MTLRAGARAALAALLAFACSSAAARARPLRPADITRIVNLEQPAISPDGRRVAFIAIFSAAGGHGSVNELRELDIASGRSRTLVRGRDVSDPRWSPSGDELGYIAQSAHARAQVYARREGDSERVLTHARGDVVDFAWRPDGNALAYEAYEAPNSSPNQETFFTAGDNEYTATALALPIHLWLAAAGGKSARRLTGGSWTLPPTDRGGIFTPQFTWTADGRQLLFTKVATTFPGDDEGSTLWRLDVSSGRTTKLTQHANLELTPQIPAGGSGLAYWYPRGGDFLSQNELHVSSGAGDVSVTRGLDRNVGGSLPLPGSGSFLICGDDGARVRAWTVSLAAPPRALALGTLDIVCDSYSSSTFDAGIAASVSKSGRLVFLAASARSARELYYMPTLSSRPRRLTSFNSFIEKLDLGTMRPLRWRGPLGAETGVIAWPPHPAPSRRYPIVLLIHGGPGLASTADFVWETWPLAQLIAARGYIVFEPNYRGSDSGGNAFMRAIYRDTVEGPSQDIMSGLAAVERLPSADPHKLAVSGWSYGGLLTSWLITRYHFWRAAVSGAAVNDEVESYNLSLSNVQNKYFFGASPYDPGGLRLYRSQSPLEFARRITTPTLIWSSTGDPVVPVTMSYALFHALEDNHVATRLVVFPTATHGPSDAAQAQSITRLWLEWLDRYLRQ